MERILRIRDWLDDRRELGYDLLRVFLGVALFVRGALFVADSEAFVRLSGTHGSQWIFTTVVGHYVALAHLIGGLLLAIGLLTRLGAAMQVPVLAGAVFFVHFGEGLLAGTQALELAALTLVLLLIYSVWGAGAYSLDARLHRGERARDRPAQGPGIAAA